MHSQYPIQGVHNQEAINNHTDVRPGKTTDQQREILSRYCLADGSSLLRL